MTAVKVLNNLAKRIGKHFIYYAGGLLSFIQADNQTTLSWLDRDPPRLCVTPG